MITAPELTELKHEAALRALEEVRDGMVLGLGSGSTAEIFVAELGRRVRSGLNVVGVPTSEAVRREAIDLGIPVIDPDACAAIDLTIDGADEIQPGTLALVKGHGGALVREKLVAMLSRREIIIADETKLVSNLGRRGPLPVAVVPFGWHSTAERLCGLGCAAELRRDAGRPFVSDDGLYVLDCSFGVIGDPVGMAQAISAITGVVEHGLFLSLAEVAVVAGHAGVQVLRASGPRDTRAARVG
ncbi:MAG: ribose-5-phosphate isomerase RpiA [Chloroflexota bacterium]